MGLLLRLALNMVALGVATWLIPGITLTGDSNYSKFATLLFVAIIFGILNAVLKPIFTTVTGCLILLTLGLFLIVINALLLMLTSWISLQANLPWQVASFTDAALGAIVISIVSWLGNQFIPDRRR